MYEDINNIQKHEFGVYSIAEKMKLRSVVIRKPFLSPLSTPRHMNSELHSPIRSQASKIREGPIFYCNID